MLPHETNEPASTTETSLPAADGTSIDGDSEQPTPDLAAETSLDASDGTVDDGEQPSSASANGHSNTEADVPFDDRTAAPVASPLRIRARSAALASSNGHSSEEDPATEQSASEPIAAPLRIRAKSATAPGIAERILPGLRARVRRPFASPGAATAIGVAAKPQPLPLRVIDWLITYRGFWLSIIAIGLAFLGQRIFSSFNGQFQEDYGDGPKYYVIACFVLILGCIYTYRNKTFFRRGAYQSPNADESKTNSNNIFTALGETFRRPGMSRIAGIPWWRFALLAGALVSAWVGVQRWRAIPPNATNPNDLAGILWWIISIVLVVLACVGQKFDVWPLNATNSDEYVDGPVDEDGRAGDEGWAFNNRRLEIALVVAIMLLAAFLRLYDLGSEPTGLHGDEAELGLLARNIVHGNFNNLPLLYPGPWYFVPSMVSYLIAPGIALFGDDSVTGLRFTTAVFGILTVFFMYLLLRLLFKSRTALVGAALLAVSDVHIQFSHYTQGTEQIALCMTAGFYFFFKGLRSKRYLDFVWSGLFAGFALYSYPTSRLIAILFVLLTVYLIVTRLTFLRDYWSHIAVCAIAALIIAAPIIAATLDNKEAFNARMRDVYITYGGAAQQTFERWGIPVPADPPYSGASPLDIGAFQNIVRNWDKGWSKMLWAQTRITFLSLNAVPDRIYFYETGKPLLNPFEALLTILGMAYFLWRWRDPRYMLFNIWFWPAMFIAVAMTINAPDVLRMAGLPPAWVAFPAVLLNKIIYEAEKTGWFIRPELRDWMRRRGYSLRQLLTFRAAPAQAVANAIPVSSIDNMLRAEMSNVAGYHPPTPQSKGSVTPSRLPTRVVRQPRTGPAYLNLILIAVITFLGFLNVQTYFNTYGQAYHYTGITTPAVYIKQLGLNYYINYMGMHQFYFTHSDIRYLDPNVTGDDFWNPPATLPIHDDYGKNAAYFFFPYHLAFLPMVKMYYPNGISDNVTYPADNSPAFTNYVVPLEQIKATEALTASYFATTDLDTSNPGPPLFSTSSYSLTNAPHDPPASLKYPASIHWQGSLYAPTYGAYTLELSSADAQGKPAPVALYLDGQPWFKLDATQTTTTTKLVFAQGWHHISLRAALPNASQRISLKWRVPGQKLDSIPAADLYNGPLSDQQYGLTGEYSPAGQAVAARRVDPFIGFMNTQKLVNASGPFDIAWKGNILIPVQDTYNFSITCVGPVTLKIDGQTVISGGPSSGSEQSVAGQAIPLTPGPHRIELDYHWQQDFGSLKLYWSYPSLGTSGGLVPPTALQPAPSIWHPQDLPDHGAAAPTNVAATITHIQPSLVIPANGAAPFSYPDGVAVDAQGNIFVGQESPPHVYKYDHSGKLLADWPALQTSAASSPRLFDLAVDSKGQVYAIDPGSKEVDVFDNNGKLIGHRDSGNKFGAYAPNGLAVDKDGNLYIANTGGNDILKVDTKDNLVHEIGGIKDYPDVAGKPDPRRLNQPIDATIGDDGSIYTIDLNQRVVKYAPDGKYVSEWRLPVVSGGVAGLKLAGYKNIIYISDNQANAIYALDTSDGSLTLYGGAGNDPGQFNNPTGLAIDAAGRLYVADRGNSRVQIFDAASVAP